MREAFRVLKTGGTAAFTIWGDKQKSQQFYIVEKALAEFISPEQLAEASKGNHFGLYEQDQGATVITDLKQAGFTGVKVYPQ
mmetsp:Transcript_32482/g.49704  ORF Transcript_32482/g.49704 Transcript_32482/m.49704 type:complete len:82 (+) Transcript_32482:549-794(+)